MKKEAGKDSILAITLLLLVLFLYFRDPTFIYISCLFIFICMLSSDISAFFDLLWKKLTHVLGVISSTIILSIIFYLLVFPLGMLMKIFKKNSLILNVGAKNSTFISRNKLFTRSDMQNPY
ncbi:MAG: hypothetical protein ABIO04_08055 [Ferruginibacter sp.]